MFTDIVGYSALMSKDEQRALQVLSKNRKITTTAIEKYNGQFIKEIGDGTLSIFQTSSDAVNCALSVQEACCNEPDLNVRIGIHIGEIVELDNDVFGDGVNIASRIEAIGEPGGIYISERVLEDVKNKPGFHAEFIGEKTLKNIPAPLKIYAVSSRVSGQLTHGEVIHQADPKKKSILVLPFMNISPDPAQEYFSDGLTEEIITDLSHISELLVISRSSSMRFKNTNKTIPEIANAVNVRYVLEGSVRKAGNSLRITAQLVDAKNDTHLWAEKYSGTLDDIFDIQEKVSRAIVDEIKPKLSPEENARISERGIENIQAYEYYLKARHDIYKLSRKGLDDALQYLEKGLEIVGENELLLASMGHIYYQYWNYGVWPDKINLQKAEICTQQVFRLKPNSIHGHFLKGILDLFYAPQKAIENFKRVLTEDSSHPDTLLWLCLYLVFQGKEKITWPFLGKLLRIDPLNPVVQILPGNLLINSGMFDEGLAALKEVLDSNPDNFAPRFHYARALAYIDKTEEAFAIIEELIDNMPVDMRGRIFTLYKHAFHNEKSEIHHLLSQEFIAWAKRDWMACFWLSEIFALIDEKKESLSWLNHAIERGFINYPLLNEFDPFLNNIRSGPEFSKLMVRVKITWDDFII